MNDNYTSAEIEHIDSTEIFNKAIEMSKSLIIIKDALANINNYISNLNDEKIWYSPAANYLKERFLKEKINLEKTYDELLSMQKKLFDVSAITDEAAKAATKIMNEMEIKSIWQV